MRLEFPPVFVRALDRQLTIHGAVPAGRSGGKPAADRLLKPVKRASKRGKFLQWHFNASRAVEDTMRVCGISRPNVFTYWTVIHREHGIGYALADDCIQIILPPGVTPDSIFK